jgi:hypothetical protein
MRWKKAAERPEKLAKLPEDAPATDTIEPRDSSTIERGKRKVREEKEKHGSHGEREPRAGQREGKKLRERESQSGRAKITGYKLKKDKE